MLIYAIVGIAGVGLLLLSLKLFAVAKARPVAAGRGGGVVYETAASRIDLWVVGAEEWWPHLRAMPLFWVAAFATMILLFLNFHFGHSRGGMWGLVILGSLFSVADLAIPFIALRDATDDGKRSVLGAVLLVVFTAMSFVVIIGSTAEIATTTGARADVGAIEFQDLQKVLAQKQVERDSIPVDRGAQALNELAESTEKAAGRESNRVRCGDKCEQLTRQATDYRARAKEAERKERLTGEIEAIKKRLAGSGEQRLDSDPLATAVEGLSFGYLTRDGVRAYGLTVLGLILVTGMTVMWVVVGGQLRDEIVWELTHRGGIADETRAQLGLAPKYTTTTTTTLLLPAARTTAAEQGLTINVQVADMRARFANDQDLLDTDALFERLLMRGEGGEVTIAALYRAYQVMVLTADPNSRYMTQPTMASKLMVISQHRDDVRVRADGVIEGWVLKPKKERADAS